MSFSTGRDWLGGFNSAASGQQAMNLGAAAMAKGNRALEVTDFYKQAIGGAADAMSGFSTAGAMLGSGALGAQSDLIVGQEQNRLLEKQMKSQNKKGIFGALGSIAGFALGGPAGAGIGGSIGGLFG